DGGLQVAVAGQVDANAPARRGPLRVVHLVDLAVAAIFREVANSEPRADSISGAVRDLRVHVPELHGGIDVDHAALARNDDGKAAGVEGGPVDGEGDLSPQIAAEEVELRAVAVAVLGLQLERAPRGTGGHDVDYAALGVIAVQARAGSIDHLDAFDAV